MVKKIILGLSLVAISTLGAQSAFSSHAVGAKVGTLGIGVEYSTNLMENLDLRVGINSYTYSTSDTKDNIKYDIDANLQTVSALLDYHPMSNGFIVSGGLMHNGNSVEYKGKSTGGTFDINGVIYDASDVGSLDGEVNFNSISPYLGIGYSTVTKSKGWHFTADAGVLYQGSASTTLNVQCGTALTAAQCITLKSDVLAEKKDFDDDLKSYKWYPVLSLGVAYKF